MYPSSVALVMIAPRTAVTPGKRRPVCRPPLGLVEIRAAQGAPAQPVAPFQMVAFRS